MPDDLPYDPDTIRILITTDNHVGYAENDPIRGNDAAVTFREIMNIAKNREVDMVLQAGDLFHVNKPSRKSMFEVITVLRETCYGDKPCELQLMSKVNLGLDDELNHLNYQDENINVAIPVFAISGNHDDAAGDSLLAPMDVLAATGLVNHFGRVQENDNISITPILLRKGETKLALYGMANVRDERLFRTFRHGQVKFFKPAKETGEWFNLMAVHQNHVAHSSTGYLPETFLPDFIDMVVWGHEHDCISSPTKNPETGFSVLQPGSSVATSLIEGEAIPKYVFILSVTGKKFTLEKVRLMTVRPFAISSVSLAMDSGIDARISNRTEVTNWLHEQVELLISKAKEEWKSRPGNENLPEEDVPLPLIRLKVDYSGGYDVENPRRFSNRFVQRVANVNDVVSFNRRRAVAMGGGHSQKRSSQNDLDNQKDNHQDINLEKIGVQNLVNEFLHSDDLLLLPETGLGDAVRRFVDNGDKDAIKTFVDKSLELQLSTLMSIANLDEDSMSSEIVKAKKRLTRDTLQRSNDQTGATMAATSNTSVLNSVSANKNTIGTNDKGAKEVDATKAKPKRGRRTVNTTLTASKKAPTRNRRKAKSPETIEESDEDVIIENIEQGDNVMDLGDNDDEEVEDIPRTTSRSTKKNTASTSRTTRAKKATTNTSVASSRTRQKSLRNAPVTSNNDESNDHDSDNDFEILEERSQGVSKSTYTPANALRAAQMASPVKKALRNSTTMATVLRSARVTSGAHSGSNKSTGSRTIGAKRKRGEPAPPPPKVSSRQEDLLYDDEDDGFS